LTFTPVEATPSALEALIRAGWSLRGIVTLAQLIAFVSFQSRLVVGLRLLNGKSIHVAQTPTVAGFWHTSPQTISGKRVHFTRDELHWEPWLAAKPLAEFTPTSRRCWRNSATAIRPTSACWRAACRCWSSVR
jgi:hypothetical protein